jgi:hypothetical protein
MDKGFAVLKRRVLQKRHRPPLDKTSGLSFDTPMYLHEYKNVHEKLQMSKQNEQKEREKTYNQTSRLENPEELQLHHNHEKILFLTVLSLFAQYKMNYW